MSNLKDYGTSTVLTAPSPADSGTTIVVQAGHGARFPSAPFYVTAHPPAEFPTLDNAEKLEVTAKSTDTLTVLRAQGDTTAKTIEAGWRISNSLFDADIPKTIDEDNMASNLDTKVPTQQSVKAYVDAAISSAKQALLPVGSIVVLGVSTNPATLYGFGTWTAITGKVLVGKADSGTFGTLDATGGAETHTLSTAEIPAHTHLAGDIAGNRDLVINNSTGVRGMFDFGGANNRATSSTGGGGAHNNLQPYIVKYMWQRTA